MNDSRFKSRSANEIARLYFRQRSNCCVSSKERDVTSSLTWSRMNAQDAILLKMIETARRCHEVRLGHFSKSKYHCQEHVFAFKIKADYRCFNWLLSRSHAKGRLIDPAGRAKVGRSPRGYSFGYLLRTFPDFGPVNVNSSRVCAVLDCT
jgi:hypothetical protein